MANKLQPLPAGSAPAWKPRGDPLAAAFAKQFGREPMIGKNQAAADFEALLKQSMKQGVEAPGLRYLEARQGDSPLVD